MTDKDKKIQYYIDKLTEKNPYYKTLICKSDFDNIKNTKIMFNKFSFEMTRRCNLSCEHCLAGKPQDIDITAEIIEKTLEQMGKVNGIIFLTGGEPFLVPESISFLIDSIIKKGLVFQRIEIITNGTILDDRASVIMDSLSRYCDYMDNRLKEYPNLKRMYTDKEIGHYVYIEISNDIYHNNNPLEAQKKLYKYSKSQGVVISLGKYHDEKNIINVGQFSDNHPLNNIPRIYSLKHRIELEDILITKTHPYYGLLPAEWYLCPKCPMEVTVYGDLIFARSCTYTNRADLAIGTVYKDIAQQIYVYNLQHALMCKDIDVCNKLLGILKNSKDEQEIKQAEDALNFAIEEKKRIEINVANEYHI